MSNASSGWLDAMKHRISYWWHFEAGPLLFMLGFFGVLGLAKLLVHLHACGAFDWLERAYR